VSAPFEVRYADPAREDLLRLFDFLLDRARTAPVFKEAPSFEKMEPS
jgi:hypothetical protein